MKKAKINADKIVISSDEKITIVADKINVREPLMSGYQPEDITNDPIVDESVPFNIADKMPNDSINILESIKDKFIQDFKNTIIQYYGLSTDISDAIEVHTVPVLRSDYTDRLHINVSKKYNEDLNLRNDILTDTFFDTYPKYECIRKYLSISVSNYGGDYFRVSIVFYYKFYLMMLKLYVVSNENHYEYEKSHASYSIYSVLDMYTDHFQYVSEYVSSDIIEYDFKGNLTIDDITLQSYIEFVLPELSNRLVEIVISKGDVNSVRVLLSNESFGEPKLPEIDVELMNIVKSFNRSLDNLNLVLTSYEISKDWPLIEFNILDSADVDAKTIKDKVLFWLSPYDKIYDDTMTVIVDKTVIKVYFNTPLDKLSSLITKYKNDYVYFTKQCYSKIRFKTDTVLRLSTKNYPHLIGFYRDGTTFETLEVNFGGEVLKDTPDKNETIQHSLEHYLPKFAANNILSVELTEKIDSNDIVIKFQGLKESIHNHVIAMIDSPVIMCLHKSPNITKMYRDIVDKDIIKESKSEIVGVSFKESLSKVDSTIKPIYYMCISEADRTKSIIDLSKIIDYLVKYYEPTFNNTAVNLNALGVELRYDKFSDTLTGKVNSILTQLHEDFNKYSYGLIYEGFGDGMAVTFVADADVGKFVVCMQLSYEKMLVIVNDILGIDAPIIEDVNEPVEFGESCAETMIKQFNESSFSIKFDTTFITYNVENEVKELCGIIQDILNKPIDRKTNTIDVSGYYQQTVDEVLEKLTAADINCHIKHSVTDDVYTYKTLTIII